MILPKVSNDFIGIFLKNMNNIEETKLTSKNKRIMREFYNLLKKFDINLDNTKQISIEQTIIDTNNKQEIINKYTFLNDHSIFLSRNIQNLIKSKLCYLYTFKINIGSLFFTTNIFILNHNEYNVEQMKVKIIQLLFFISNFITNRKLRTLEINIILTKLKKELPTNPNEILDSYHINTGVTWPCKSEGEILVYREEEWFKVLIHELFHSMCFDFSQLNINKLIKDKITKMFFIKNSYFSVTETYCEFWANIINSILMSYNITDNFNDFLYQFEIFNTFEKYFSIFQSIKVLNHMNLTYEILISKSNIHKKLSIQNYKEKTNVLGYFIIKMIWLFYTNEMFLFFSDTHEKNIINSNKNYNYLTLLINKTSQLYNKRKLLKEIKKYSKIFNQLTIDIPIIDSQIDITRSLRMTVVEIN